jgi:hypothetical protein
MGLAYIPSDEVLASALHFLPASAGSACKHVLLYEILLHLMCDAQRKPRKDDPEARHKAEINRKRALISGRTTQNRASYFSRVIFLLMKRRFMSLLYGAPYVRFLSFLYGYPPRSIHGT